MTELNWGDKKVAQGDVKAARCRGGFTPPPGGMNPPLRA